MLTKDVLLLTIISYLVSQDSFKSFITGMPVWIKVVAGIMVVLDILVAIFGKTNASRNS